MNLVLSEEKQKEVVSNYDKIAWKTVHRFSSGRPASKEDREDLHQECMIVLFKHLLKCENDEDIYRFQAMDMVNAMSRYVLGLKKFSTPRDTERYRELIERQPETISYDDMIRTAQGRRFEDDSVTRIDFERFYETLTDRQRDIILKRLIGMNNHEIAIERDIATQNVSKALARIRRRACDQMNIPASVKRRRS